ncbi:fatty acid-binding protein [Elysia marginata]|uniref:Fatty acid-binding protein n=1 Tax=Elysia marginata TaxID=1093978 RepID=A0AAV4EGI2_9GAST|nr:fatty acid-binding protein [Elysia marginata]
MDAVLGSWKIKEGSEKNYDHFFKEMGIPDEAAREYMKRTILLSFSKDGDKFTMKEVITNDPAKKSASYTYELGKEFDTVDVDDQPLKMKMEWDGSKFNETYSYPQSPPVHTTREVVGGIMKVAMTVNGVTATDEWEKC